MRVNMKKRLLTILLANIAFVAYTQTTEAEDVLKTKNNDTIMGWKYGTTISLNFTQVKHKNWAAGGQNSISTNGLVSLYANNKQKNSSWENYLEIGYGTLKQGKESEWWKTDDKIDLTSKYGQRASKSWYYAGLLNFKTQMTAGYNYPNDSTKISDLLAPGYIIGAIGMDYKPKDELTAFLAPLTGKITLVNDETLANAGAFGVDPAVYDSITNELITAGKKNRSEFGGYVRLFYKKDIMENVRLQSKLDLFSNYLNKPENIDVNWEVLISMKVNKYISANISTQLIYDDDIDIVIDEKTGKKGPRVQFKEVLGIGFSYKF